MRAERRDEVTNRRAVDAGPAYTVVMSDASSTNPRAALYASAALWITVFIGAGLGNIWIEWADAAREGAPFDLTSLSLAEGSSLLVSLLLLPLLLLGCRRWPLSLDNWPRRLPGYLVGSLAWSALHVGGMVALRKAIHASMGLHYDYGPWLANFVYEYGKDVQTFFLIVTVAHSFEWYARLRQGEAHALSSPDEGIRAVPEAAQPERPKRFLVRKLGRDFLIATDDIEWLQASGNYVNLHLGGRVYPLRATIGGIESQLDPDKFSRVHRSHIVNLAMIASIEPTDAGDARIHLKDGSVVPCSRRYRHVLRGEAAAGLPS